MRTANRLRSAALLAAFGSVFTLAGCAGGEDVTAQSLRVARQRWERSAIRDYDLEWTSSGLSNSHYRVTVRGGKVRAIESVFRGKGTEVHPADPKYYGVEGLFMIIADELAQLEGKAPFGQPKGTRAVLRFTPDPTLGYPRSYRRDVLGTPLALRIDVIHFDPNPPLARTTPSP